MTSHKETALITAIDKANQLSHDIDMSDSYPEALIGEWQLLVEWIRELGVPQDYMDWLVIAPENW